MRTILTLVACFLFGILGAQNLLANGDAESGSLTGWSASSALIGVTTDVTQTNGTVLPFEGDYFFTFSNQPGDTATLTQNGLIDIALDSLRLVGYFHGEFISGLGENDFGEAILYIFDVDGLLIDSSSTGELQPDSAESWNEFIVELPLLPNSFSWKVDLKGSREAGDFINVFYDSLELTNLGTPSSTFSLPRKNLSAIYPNPSSGFIYLDYDPLEDVKLVEIYALNGELVKTISGQRIEEIDLTNLESGQYLMVGFNSRNERLVRQLIHIN